MSPEELFEKADRLEDSGDERGALRLWRELSKAHPEPAGLCRHAWLANELGEKDEAEHAFQRAIELDGSLAAAYQGLGSMAIDRGGFEDADDGPLRRGCECGEKQQEGEGSWLHVSLVYASPEGEFSIFS